MNVLQCIAVGDAYGRPFEFNTREFIDEHNDVNGYKQRETERFQGTGYFTDDTQMSIAIAEQMLSRSEPSQIGYAYHFIKAFKRDPRGGYSKRLHNALEKADETNPLEFILNCKQAGMSSNGSVMRAVPLGMLPDIKDIMNRSIMHTSVTHGHIDAVNSALVVSLTGHFFYHVFKFIEGDLQKKYAYYLTWIRSIVGVSVFNDIYQSYNMNTKYELQCDAKSTAAISIKIAWGLLKENKPLEPIKGREVLYQAVQVGGDVDSSASIALGLYSLRPDMSLINIPTTFNVMETRMYTLPLIKQLDIELTEEFPRAGEFTPLK